MTRTTTTHNPLQARAGKLTLASFSFFAVALVWCALASAGTYLDDNCPSAPTPNSDPGPYVIFGSPQTSKGSCSGGAGDWIGPRGGSMSPGSSDGVKVTVPSGSGITIHEAKIWWAVPGKISGADNFAVAYANGNGVGEANTPLGPTGADTFTLPSSTTTFELADYCSGDDAGAGCTYGGGENPNLELFGSELTLAESVPPKGSPTGGGLESSGSVSGSQSLSYSSEDAGSGVRLVELQVDGSVVASKDYKSVCTYSNFAACPTSESDSIAWNTAGVVDGSHTVQLTVQDAAQNTATIYTGSITTDNAPSNTSAPAVVASQVIVGTSLTAQPGSWTEPTGAGSITYAYQWQDCNSDGEDCHAISGAQNSTYTPAPSDIGHALRVTVSATDSDGTRSATSEPTTAVVSNPGSLGAPNGPGGSNPGSGSTGSGGGGGGTTTTTTTTTTSILTVGIGAPNGIGASEATFIHLGVGHTVSLPHAKGAFKPVPKGSHVLKIPGHLATIQGAPVAGANLDILEEAAGTSRFRVIARTRTSAAGTFNVAIPAGPSRRIEVAYRAFSGDATYAATATVAETVQAHVTMHAKFVRPGVVKFTGVVSGPIPHGGALVEMLVKYKGHIDTFRKKRTSEKGRFTVVYEFEGGIGRWPFQAEVPSGQAKFPYSTGYSNVVNVTTK